MGCYGGNTGLRVVQFRLALRPSHQMGSWWPRASYENTVKLWNVELMAFPVTLYGHSDAASHLIFSPNSTMLASGSDDATIELWSLSGNELRTLRGHSGSIIAVVFSHTGQLLASPSCDNAVNCGICA